VYCSLTCCGKDQQVLKKCSQCDKKFLGGKKTCSHACANKARSRISYTRENKFNKAYRGTLIKEKLANKRGGKCQKCGYANYAILQVHHKKERHKGGTNTSSNLELLCPNCHATHHYGRALYEDK